MGFWSLLVLFGFSKTQNPKTKTKVSGPTRQGPKTRKNKNQKLGFGFWFFEKKQKPEKNKSFRVNQPGTQNSKNQKPKVRFWFLVFWKNKNQKTKVSGPIRPGTQNSKNQNQKLGFSKKQKPKPQFWFWLGVPGLIGPETFAFLVLGFLKKQKNSKTQGFCHMCSCYFLNSNVLFKRVPSFSKKHSFFEEISFQRTMMFF